jgi:hypothetical protein
MVERALNSASVFANQGTIQLALSGLTVGVNDRLEVVTSDVVVRRDRPASQVEVARRLAVFVEEAVVAALRERYFPLELTAVARSTLRLPDA